MISKVSLIVISLVYLALVGCTLAVDVADKRISPERVISRIEVQDQALTLIGHAVKELQEKVKGLEDAKK